MSEKKSLDKIDWSNVHGLPVRYLVDTPRWSTDVMSRWTLQLAQAIAASESDRLRQPVNVIDEHTGLIVSTHASVLIENSKQ